MFDLPDYTKRDNRMARANGLHPHDPHAPLTLTFSGRTICWTCSSEARLKKQWWQFFKKTTVDWPCSKVNGL